MARNHSGDGEELSMKMVVHAGNNYKQEVDAENADQAVIRAFRQRLPNSIGEAMLVKVGRSSSYSNTANLLKRIGADKLFTPHKRGFILDTTSSAIAPVE